MELVDLIWRSISLLGVLVSCENVRNLSRCDRGKMSGRPFTTWKPPRLMISLPVLPDSNKDIAISTVTERTCLAWSYCFGIRPWTHSWYFLHRNHNHMKRSRNSGKKYIITPIFKIIFNSIILGVCIADLRHLLPQSYCRCFRRAIQFFSWVALARGKTKCKWRGKSVWES